MQTLQSRVVLVLASGLVCGCSLLFDGSRYSNNSVTHTDGGFPDDGAAPLSDGARSANDGSIPNDSGVPIDCTEPCGSGDYCVMGLCRPCDADSDNYVVSSPQCDSH